MVMLLKLNDAAGFLTDGGCCDGAGFWRMHLLPFVVGRRNQIKKHQTLIVFLSHSIFFFDIFPATMDVVLLRNQMLSWLSCSLEGIFPMVFGRDDSYAVVRVALAVLRLESCV